MSTIKYICAILILGWCYTARAQFSSDIPLRKDICSGKLENGLSYYILPNQWPKERASFYFVQNVGAILENDNQNGLAHFLEHMAFNGTEHFKGKGFIKMLEQHGVVFGRDINAYTSLDETVYNLSNVPVDNKQLLDSCLWVLHDWSGYLLLEDHEIDAERGVIHEEWRTRRTPAFRINAQTNPVLYHSSKYAKRDVIGNLDIIDHFPYQDLRDYYKKWYRPDLQAVIIVGDVDTQEMEARIKQIFSSIPLYKNRAKRTYETIPDNDSLLYKLATDKEAQQITITWQHKFDKPLLVSKEVKAQNFIANLSFYMLKKRYAEFILNNPNTAALSMSAGINELSRLQKASRLVVIPKKERIAEAFGELWTEWQRALQYGFTNAELKRAKETWLNAYANQVTNKDKISNDDIAYELQQHFLKATACLTPDEELSFVKTVFDTLTVNQINSQFQSYSGNSNNVLLVSGPEKEDISYPELSAYKKIMASIAKQKLQAYTDNESNAAFITDSLPENSYNTLSADEKIEGVKSYVFKNGVKVFLYPTTLANDEILFYGFSPGGKSVLESKQIPSAELAPSLALASGAGDFNKTAFDKYFNGSRAQVKPYISERFEGFTGSSNHNDLEDLLQQTYMFFNHPRFDSTIYTRYADYYQSSLENLQSNNRQRMNDTITLVNSSYSKRSWLFNQDYIDHLNLNEAAQIYKNRFSNSKDFTFVVVGNITENDLPLLNKYLGNLSSNDGRIETSKIHPYALVDKEVNKTLIYPMSVPKTTVYIHLENTKVKYSKKQAYMAYFISQILSKRYIETIREEEGGSYGVNVSAILDRTPTPQFSMEIKFDCAPEKADDLIQIVYAEIEKAMNQLSDSTVIENIKNDLKKSNDQQINTNSYWLNTIVKNVRENTPYIDMQTQNEIIESITPNEIKKYAKKVLQKAHKAQVIMSPAQFNNQ